jgi:hypothetical protein
LAQQPLRGGNTPLKGGSNLPKDGNNLLGIDNRTSKRSRSGKTSTSRSGPLAKDHQVGHLDEYF